MVAVILEVSLFLDFFRYSELSASGTRIYGKLLLTGQNRFFRYLLYGGLVAAYAYGEVSGAGAAGRETFVSLFNDSIFQRVE